MNPTPPKKIGIIGESPNDTYALRNLLKRQFPEHDYQIMVEHLPGSMLDSKLIAQEIKLAYKDLCPDVVIYVRDLDDHASAQKDVRKKMQEKREFRNRIYERIRKALHDQAGHSDLPVIFLLIQFEIEALILADVETANQILKCTIALDGKNPRDIPDPKAHIRTFCSYTESDCPKIFKKLRYEIITTNHSDFQDFSREIQLIIHTEYQA